MGVLTDPVVMTDPLATVLDREIDKTIGRCRTLEDIDAALRSNPGPSVRGEDDHENDHDHRAHAVDEHPVIGVHGGSPPVVMRACLRWQRHLA